MYEDRLKYTYLGGVGNETFGFDRWLNQRLYNSKDWRQLHNDIIIRDNGCDLACKGCDLYDKILIHHLNPITYDDVVNHADCIFDSENLICVSHDTHNYIHYGIQNGIFPKSTLEKTPNDTCPWK